jgi:hypothetical protein
MAEESKSIRKRESGSSQLIRVEKSLVSRGLRQLDQLSLEQKCKAIGEDTVLKLRIIRKIGEGAVLESAHSPDGSILVVNTVKGIFVHNNPGGARIAHLELDEDVECIDVSPDNNTIAIGTHERSF